jgi:glycosyltransferase involved in cell wall biosynthesis
VPRVSVIIPAHNAAAYIEQTLASVAAQTYEDWEVVVADDASGDDTARRAEGAAPRTRVVRTERNLGPAGTRNLALEHASGELIAFLDADDLWLPTYLERQVARYDAEAPRPGAPVGIVACDARLRGPDGDLPGTYMTQFRDPAQPLSLERVLARNRIYVSTVVPRAAGEEVGGFAPELFGTEDHDLWVRILETGRRAVLNLEVLAVYRKNTGSVSSNIARQGANNQKTYRRALERGRLTPRQARIARRELHYNRAMEAVAAAWLDRSPAGALRALPTAAWVAATRPGHWRDWMSVLRGA